MSALDDPRVEPIAYVVRPTGYDDLFHSDKSLWCLYVVDGRVQGWSIRRFSPTDQSAMNRKGEFIHESRGSGHNKARRWSLDEALRIALSHVDTLRLNGATAVEASARVRAREGAD